MLDSEQVLGTSVKCCQRRQLEHVYISELAQLISTSDMDRPSKTSVQQIGSANGCSSDAVQLGEISSSRPVLYANDFGPLLLEALEAFGFIVNASFQIEYVTENVSELIGYRADQLVGQSVFSLLHQQDQQHFSAVVQPLLQPHSRGCQPDSLQRSRIVICRILVNTRTDSTTTTPTSSSVAALSAAMDSKSALSDHSSADYESMQISVLKKMRPPELVLMDDSTSIESALDTQLLVCMARRINDVKPSVPAASASLSATPASSTAVSNIASTLSPSLTPVSASASSLPAIGGSSHPPASSTSTSSSVDTVSPVLQSSETFVTRLDAAGKILSLDAQNSSRACHANFNQDLVGRSLVALTHRADQVRLAGFLQRVATAGDQEGPLLLDDVRVQTPSTPGRYMCVQTRARRLVTSGDGTRCIISALHTVSREEVVSPCLPSPSMEPVGLHSTDSAFSAPLETHTVAAEFSDQDLFSELFGDTPLPAVTSSSASSSTSASQAACHVLRKSAAAGEQRFTAHSALAGGGETETVTGTACHSPRHPVAVSHTQSLMQDLLTSDGVDRKPTVVSPLLPSPAAGAPSGGCLVTSAAGAHSGGCLVTSAAGAPSGGCDNMLRQLLNDRNENRCRPARNEELMLLLNGAPVEPRRRSTSASVVYGSPGSAFVEGHAPVTGLKRVADEDLGEPQKQAKRHSRCASGGSGLVGGSSCDIAGDSNKNRMLSELLSRSCQRTDNNISPIPAPVVRPSDLPQNKLPCREELQRKIQLHVRADTPVHVQLHALGDAALSLGGAGVESLLLARTGESNGLSVNSVSSSVVNNNNNNNNGDSSELDNILDDIITFENQLSGSGGGSSGQFVSSPASVPNNVNEKNAIHNIQWYLMQTESNVVTPPSAQCAPVRNGSAGVVGPPPYSVVRAPVGGLTSQINMVRSHMPLQPGVSQNKLTSQQMAELHRLLQQQQKQHMVATSSSEHVLQSSLHSFDHATINSVPPNVSLQTQVPTRITAVSQQNSSDVAASPHSPFSVSYRQQQQQHQIEACPSPVAPPIVPHMPRPILVGNQQQGACPAIAPPTNTQTLRPLIAGRLQQQNPELNAQLSGVYDVRGQSYQLPHRSTSTATTRVSNTQQYGFSQQMVRPNPVGASPSAITGVVSNQSSSPAYSWQSEFVRQELRRSIVTGQQQQPRPGGRSLTREDLEKLGLQVPTSSVGDSSWLSCSSPGNVADVSSDTLSHQPCTPHANLAIPAPHPPTPLSSMSATAPHPSPAGTHRTGTQPSLLRNLLLSE